MEGNMASNEPNKSPPQQYSSTTASSRVSPPNGTNNWLDKNRKKRDNARDKEWSREKVMRKENSKDEEVGEKPKEDPKSVPMTQVNMCQPSTSFAPFGYGAPERPFPMMAPYNIYPQWPMSSMDNHSMATTNPSATVSTSTMSTGMEMGAGPSSAMNPYAFMGMPGEPMYGMMGGMGNFCPFPMMNGQEGMVMAQVKEVITLQTCVLYPPPPALDTRPQRERPPGCKTVFVGGLPDKCTEEIIREMFEKFGEIVTIRMSKKNFCHIRFSAEHYVDQALFLSGYRVKIENKEDTTHFGRLHVDYAQARDDQYEYECHQRALQREARHRARMEQLALRPPTPPPVVHYSDHEATILGEKLRNEETFKQAVHILITWLERGECSKRNAGYFYSMIQSTNSHVRRLMNEKGKSEDELNKAKLMLQQKMAGIALQFNEIDKVFDAASLQKVWDHFTKAQRKNIDMWKKQTSEIKKAHSDELVGDRVEDEMDVSDGEDSPKNDSNSQEEVIKLKEEVDSLRNQLRVAQQEVIAVKNEGAEVVEKMRKNFHISHQKNMDLQKQLDELRKGAKASETNGDATHSERSSIGPMCGKCLSPPDKAGVTESEGTFNSKYMQIWIIRIKVTISAFQFLPTLTLLRSRDTPYVTST